MWLLDTDSLELKEFGDELPSYSILSHTWGHEEVTFKDLQHGWLTNPGSRKLRATCKQSSLDGYRWTWIDTCCIDRTSHDALQEAIRSMYKWYAQAAACYVHLADVRSIGSIDTGNDSEFRRSRWFTRSWTLQELIAPRNVIFFTASWKKIGTKHTLQHLIANITGIPPTCLSGESQPREFSVVTRFSWASKRECRKREDVAYSLMGLFDVYMPILYGEYDKAFFRLQEHIFRQTADQSMLAWSVSKDDYRYGNRSCIFATSPVDFTGAPERRLDAIGSPSRMLIDAGLDISLVLTPAPAEMLSDNNMSLNGAVKLYTASLDYGPDDEHAFQIVLGATPSTQIPDLSAITFHRIASSLITAKREHNAGYTQIFIRNGMDTLSRYRQSGTLPDHRGIGSAKYSSSNTPGSDNTEDESEQSNADLIVNSLHNEMVSNVNGKRFLPEGILTTILTENAMKQALLEVHIVSELPDDFYLRASQSLKIFAVLALCGLLRYFWPLVDTIKISDQSLPMPQPNVLFQPTVMAEDATGWIIWKKAVTHFGKQSYARHFFQTQWSFLAPVYSLESGIQHHTLSTNCVLPSISRSGFPRGGGFGEVRKIQIHPAHLRFGLQPSTQPPVTSTTNEFFAVKRLHTTSILEFEQERQALERLQNPSRHILPLLATYEIQRSTLDLNTLYYGPVLSYDFIFPWADCNLLELWKSDTYCGDEAIAPWLAQQCWMLSDALSHIHEVVEIYWAPDRGSSKRCYNIHGDIKPANILRFSTTSQSYPKDLGQLVIGDFGKTTLQPERVRPIPRGSSCAFFPTYAAPETMALGVISRETDVWALGCVFLEFITWFIMGPTAVSDDFQRMRFLDDDTSLGYRHDGFCKITSRTETEVRAILKPSVQEWMNRVSSDARCSKFVKDFLAIVQKAMLIPDAQRRKTAKYVSQGLEKIYRSCLQDPLYHSSNPVAPPEESQDKHTWRRRLPLYRRLRSIISSASALYNS